jgi:hypothetical protein
MKLFRLISILLTTATITNAQIIVGILAAIELEALIFEGAAVEEIASLAIDASVQITGALEAGAEEMNFAAGVDTAWAFVEEAGGAGVPAAADQLPAVVAGAFEVPVFTESAAVGATTNVEGAIYLQDVAVNILGENVPMSVIGDFTGTATVGEDGAIVINNGAVTFSDVYFGVNGLGTDLYATVERAEVAFQQMPDGPLG